MKLIDQADLPDDPRNRSLKNTARVDISIYLDVPDRVLQKLPPWQTMAIDLAREKIGESSTVGDLLRRLEPYTEGAVVRASGR